MGPTRSRPNHARLRNAALGNFDNIMPVSNRIFETRIRYGPGYRLYFMSAGETVIAPLCGRGKGIQRRGIERARRLALGMRLNISA